ncbi:MAG: helix-turn-helix transcriptional regulator [Ekhidna sp.]
MDNQKAAILKVIAANIVEIRKQKGITQEQLAHKANIDRSYMGYIENAKHNISVGMLERIAIALDVEIIKLVSK